MNNRRYAGGAGGWGFACIIGYLLLVSPPGAVGDTVSGLILSEVLEARGLALGDAQMGLDDVTATQVNPAAAAGLKVPYVAAFMKPAPLGQLMGSFEYAQPAKVGTLAASLSYQTFGTVEVVSPQGLRQFNAGSDYVLAASYGAEIYRGVKGGVRVKYLSSELAETYQAYAWAADIGALMPLPLPGVTVGAGMRNLGSGLKFVSVLERLPTELRGGVTYAATFNKVSALFATDAIYGLAPNEFGAGVGVEVTWQRMVSARAGYRSGIGGQPERVTLGLGLSWQGMALDYVVESPARLFGGNQGVSISYRFLPA